MAAVLQFVQVGYRLALHSLEYAPLDARLEPLRVLRVQHRVVIQNLEAHVFPDSVEPLEEQQSDAAGLEPSQAELLTARPGHGLAASFRDLHDRIVVLLVLVEIFLHDVHHVVERRRFDFRLPLLVNELLIHSAFPFFRRQYRPVETFLVAG